MQPKYRLLNGQLSITATVDVDYRHYRSNITPLCLQEAPLAALLSRHILHHPLRKKAHCLLDSSSESF